MRVAVADDAVILREGLARLLDEAGFEVVGLAANAEELYQVVDAERPDVAIIDIRMPPTHTDEGLRAAREIRSRWPGTGILVLSQHVQPAYAVELLSSGTSGVGYLLKDRVSNLADLCTSVRQIGEGGSVLDPTVVAQLVDQRRQVDDPLAALTDRERDVLALMAEGRTNKAIGERLYISEHTVEKHISSIFAALGLPASADDHRRVIAVVRFLDSRAQ
jgi:DNA-binding NarL/FixJ family response regulator